MRLRWSVGITWRSPLAPAARCSRRGSRRPSCAPGPSRPRPPRAPPPRAPSSPARTAAVPAAVIFDLDGVLLDSEQLWNEAKHELVQQAGGRWREDAPQAMMGMSAPEWSAY